MMTSQLFWHSVTGTGFWGVCWEGFSPPILLPDWWGHISHAGAPELWVVPVSVAKYPWSHLGSKGSTTVQRYCPNRWQLVWEEVWLSHHGICLCNPFLKLYAVLLDTQHLLKVMSFICSTDFCYFIPQPAVLQFGDLIILPQFLWLTSRFFVCSPTLAMYHCQSISMAKCCGTGVTVPSVLTNPSLHFSMTEIPAKIVMKPWHHMVLCLCIHLCISTYFCVAGYWLAYS